MLHSTKEQSPTQQNPGHLQPGCWPLGRPLGLRPWCSWQVVGPVQNERQTLGGHPWDPPASLKRKVWRPFSSDLARSEGHRGRRGSQ